MIYYNEQKFKAKKLKLGFVFQNPMDQFIAKTVHDEIYLTIMDEPTYRQDEELTIKIMNQLREVVEKEGRSFS